MLLGVDVSHHQNPAKIDWEKLFQSNVRFAFIRATYGVKEDETFLDHVEYARQSGILTGAYHFLRYKSSQPAEAQAEAFLEALEPLAPHAQPMLLPMLDLEDNSFDDPINTAHDRRTFVEMTNTWLRIVEKELGRMAGIYTRASFFDHDLGAPAGFGVRPLWIAHYTTKPSPNLPQAWSGHTFWQFTDKGKLPGFDRRLDLNRFDGTQEEMEALATNTPFSDSPDLPPETENRVAPLGAETLAVMRIAAKGLNLRSAMQVNNGTFIITLPLGHRVEILAKDQIDAKGRAWAHVRTFVGSAEQTGFVAQSYLRPLAGDPIEALVDSTVTEWKRFNFGAGKETVFPYWDFVGEMWRDLDPNSKITGKNTSIFWSAAAMSFFVHRAGPAYDGFRRSAQHSIYIHDSIMKRDANAAAPFWGFRLSEAPVEIGDLVCIDRTDAGIDFDFARTHADFSSHTDVVVGIHHGVAVTLGGNVSNSVSSKEFDLGPDGKLKPGKKLFMLMKNRTAGV
ncbi:DUF2272 domain-containing protein [Poseidonocella sp. HB161398]|uniref:DUF2272 domain-containing protein n=1 Tax=Poseidonocella sp. HB161398 TaxID=2320855 RepID=UPI001109F606|nr:DUF2272 domain-containing protein [Poseidonocella sp. HB161398]